MNAAGTGAARARLVEQRALWARKPLLGAVYGPWFEALVAALPAAGRALEVGAGPGVFAPHARRARPRLHLVSSDVVALPWNDAAADAAALPFGDRAFDAVVGLDVLHHLARPAAFFGEAARVLRPGAPLAVVEPWVTPLSYPVYRYFHQEGLRPGLDPWHPFDPAQKAPFDGDGGLFWRLVRTTPVQRWRAFGFTPPRLTLFNGFAYLLSLGFRERSLLPPRLLPLVQRAEHAVRALAPLTALRAGAVWRRLSEAEAETGSGAGDDGPAAPPRAGNGGCP